MCTNDDDEADATSTAPAGCPTPRPRILHRLRADAPHRPATVLVLPPERVRPGTTRLPGTGTPRVREMARRGRHEAKSPYDEHYWAIPTLGVTHLHLADDRWSDYCTIVASQLIPVSPLWYQLLPTDGSTPRVTMYAPSGRYPITAGRDGSHQTADKRSGMYRRCMTRGAATILIVSSIRQRMESRPLSDVSAGHASAGASTQD